MKIAAEGPVGEALGPFLMGPTAIAFGTDEAATAKAVLDATRPYKVVRITGAVLGDRAIDADGVRRLAALPPRDGPLASSRAGSRRRWRRRPGCSQRRSRTSPAASPRSHDQKSAA